VSVYASDNDGNSQVKTFQLVVENLPVPETPPAIIDVPAQAGTVGTAFNLALASFVTPTDGDAVTYHVSGLPA